jgi:HSP20 family molecular chaperone IbpA
MQVQLQATEESFSSVARQLSKWVDQMLTPEYRRYSPGEAWAPAVNMDPTAVGLKVEAGRLLISGERPTPRPGKTKRLACTHLMEIDHGPFLRSIEVPATVDMEVINAKYRAGLLWITLPKKPAP